MELDIDVTVESGQIRAIPVPVTAVDVVLIYGPCTLAGWSLREAAGDASNENEGSVTSPAAGATIVQLTGLAAGEYSVEWSVELAGTLAAADANNFELVPSTGPTIPSLNQAVANVYQQATENVVLGANGSIAIKAIALGTVGAIYSAVLVITQTLIPQAIVELQDGNQPLGEVALAEGAADIEHFGREGIRVNQMIRLHVVSGTVTGTVYAVFKR